MREALRIDKKVYGDEHPDVARDLNNLAQLLEQQVGLLVHTLLNGNISAIYSIQGKLEEAEAPMREALAIFKKVLGEEHPNVAVLLNNIAEVLRAQVRPAGSCCWARISILVSLIIYIGEFG